MRTKPNPTPPSDRFYRCEWTLAGSTLVIVEPVRR